MQSAGERERGECVEAVISKKSVTTPSSSVAQTPRRSFRRFLRRAFPSNQNVSPCALLYTAITMTSASPNPPLTDLSHAGTGQRGRLPRKPEGLHHHRHDHELYQHQKEHAAQHVSEMPHHVRLLGVANDAKTIGNSLQYHREPRSISPHKTATKEGEK